MTRILGVTGWSGSGKTTLVRQLIPRLVGQGLSVSTIKHAHHRFDVDQPGKDSCVHREAGARQVLVASDIRWALMSELRGAPENHVVNIREVRLAAGAEFVVMICGDIMTMPGLPKVPSANKIDLVDGKVVGLF